MNNVAETLYATGFWLLDQQRPSDALHVFRTMLAVAPADERGWLGLGEAHERLEQLDKAVRLYSLGLVTCTTSARLWLASARIATKLGRDEQALLAFDRARELAEEHDEETFVMQIEAEKSAA